MKFQPKFYKTSPSGLVLKLETVSDKVGNNYHVVTTSQGVNENQHFFFTHLSSALDFNNLIFSNMKSLNFYYRYKGYISGKIYFDFISRHRFTISFVAKRFGISPDCVTRSMPFLVGYC